MYIYCGFCGTQDVLNIFATPGMDGDQVWMCCAGRRVARHMWRVAIVVTMLRLALLRPVQGCDIGPARFIWGAAPHSGIYLFYYSLANVCE